MTLPGLICSGAGNGDYANITNIAVRCGLLRGIPQRLDDGPGVLFDAGSRWSQPIYACATAIKATVKTVHFRFNGTDDLKSLTIDKVEQKQYPSENSKPLWGVEDTGNKYRMSEIKLLWGLISEEYANLRNVSSIRQEHLYLPGYMDTLFSVGLASYGLQNVPASDFYVGALGSAYRIGDDSGIGTMAGSAEYVFFPTNFIRISNDGTGNSSFHTRDFFKMPVTKLDTHYARTGTDSLMI